MSYTRDPDHYTRGVGAVQAVDKVLAQRRNRGRARMLGDAALESQRRDRLRARLLRPALGAVNQLGTKTQDTGGNTSTSQPTPTISGGTGNSGQPMVVRPTRSLTAQQFASKGVIVTTPYAAPGRPWQPTDPVCGPNQTGTYPNCFDTPGVTSAPPVPLPPINPVDTSTVPTSQVGVSSGGPIGGAGSGGGGVTVTPDDGSSVDTDTSVLTPTAPDYQKYAVYAGGAVVLYLLWRSMQKGR